MTQKTFSSREIAQIKRTAQNVAPLTIKRDKVLAKVKELYAELETLDAQIDAWETAVKAMTGGYPTNELVSRVVTETTKEDGKTVKTTTFVLKYPETVVPPFGMCEDNTACEPVTDSLYNPDSDEPFNGDSGSAMTEGEQIE